MDYITHFNTKLKKTDNNNLTRENYCVPSKKIDSKYKRIIKKATTFVKEHNRPPLLCPSCYYEFPNRIFEDEEHFSDTFIEKHYKDCMENFDLNMNYFTRLNFDKFNEYLLKFVKKKKFNEVDDLDILKDKKGIYILVLDNYKQVYIGISNSIKKRILQHWRTKKDFGHLLCGEVDTSVLSIDSFGALDTTRIFYKELKWYQDLDEYEERIVKEFKNEYMLNRISGGINGDDDSLSRFLKAQSTIHKRKLK